MNELATINQTMSSREISELTGKRHDHVLRDCDNLNLSYEKLGLPKIGDGYYTHPNTGSQQHREFLLTRMQTFDLMTGYSAELRIRVNRRWEELEKQNVLDFTNPNTVLMLAQNWAKAEQEKKQLQEANEIQAKELKAAEPKVIFADSVVASNDSVLIGELARILKQNGIEIGQNRLFEWMRQKGYLCSKGNLYNQPTQSAMDMGLFEIKKTTINRPDSDPFIQTTTKVTGKGQIYFVNKFLYNKSKAQ